MEKNKKRVAGRDVRARGELSKVVQFLCAARDAFLFAPMASSTTRGTALCSYEHYGACGVNY